MAQGVNQSQSDARGRASSSPELGSPSHVIQYNKQTGRPIRRSAGQKKNVAGFVDSAMIEEYEEEASDSLSEDEEGNPVLPKRSSKRKRSPSPTPPPLDPIIYDEAPDEQSDEETLGSLQRHPGPPPITLQFNVPLGFHGPLVVKLDSSVLDAIDGPPRDLKPPTSRRRRTESVAPAATVIPPKPGSGSWRAGFLDLPPELRNKIYRFVFLDDHDLIILRPTNFCKSAAFLRCCKLVHSEGCSVLYGENRFVFERNRNTRSPFWDPVPQEIGYKDCRRFLNMIGPENLQYLRDIKFIFEDANPGSTPYLGSHEARRYIHDGHLIDCLRTLRGAKLRKLTLMFAGRRQLIRTDVEFLGYLEQLKADEIIHSLSRWFYGNKINAPVFESLKERMTRKKRLYAGKE
ncbi:hypothetical protein CC78DRAFT_530045 [Lojkania enalia]|uniref:F-box domain-containing protein n=1 Tax=Lojkania enalia TaxID=147567 RepID=A0A9P4KHB4_9PLEO|nr:hypothetical protein CC78DRAFT_530045 [Didymosphaeria enalia]